MSDRKILLFIFSVIFYCLYSVNMWFMTSNENEETPVAVVQIKKQTTTKPNSTAVKIEVKTKMVPLFIKNRCSVLEVFTKKPINIKRKIKRRDDMEGENYALTTAISIFLGILLLNALLDVLKAKEEERAKRKLNPNGERSQSLAEFANKKMLRRESSKMILQLFQISEDTNIDEDANEKKNRRDVKPYTRGESINSYLSEKPRKTENSAPASIGEVAEPRIKTKRQSVAKLIGARPAPMLRRSSFPVLPMNPEIQARVIGSKQSSFDSDDEDGKGRRVRIIRRF